MTQIVGRRLGRYEVQQEIGRGGMARVYRALDTLLQRHVAIKVMAPQLELDPEFADRFEREAITAANLHHPAIVTVYDVGDQDGLRYLAMEYIRGCTLHAILTERGALGLGYAVSLLEPVARALDFAHTQGAVHRDVKPHNIMVDVDGRVLLTDFGIAQAPETENSQRLTRTGVFMGTPEYISPEQAQARRVDGRSDLYSLGIVAYEIITGRVPFSGATPNLLVAHTQTPPPPATSVVSNLPHEVDAVLARALAKDPQARFATGIAMVEALRIVARRNGVRPATVQQIAALTQPLDTAAKGTTALPVPPVPLMPDPTTPAPVPPAPVGEHTLVAPPRQVARPQSAIPPTPVRNPQARRWLMIGVPLLVGVFVVALAVFFSGRADGTASIPPTPPTPTLELPTAGSQPGGVIPGGALTATAPAPSPSLPAPTPEQATALSLSTSVAPPTASVGATLASSATLTPTIAATATITPTVRPATRPATRVPASRTPAPTLPTVPALPPTDAPTVLPSEPPESTPIDTIEPTAQPTATSVPATATAKPTSTDTPFPTVRVNPTEP